MKMLKVHNFFILIWLHSFCLENAIANEIDRRSLRIASTNFQNELVHEMQESFGNISNSYLNELSLWLIEVKGFNALNTKLKSVETTTNLNQKLVLTKQFIDISRDKNIINMQELTILRNINFLQNIQNYLHDMQEDLYKQSRQIRTYEICSQFLTTNVKSQKNLQSLKAAVLLPENKTECTVNNITLDIFDFGLKLYANVQGIGAAIIDEYLNTVRQLIEEVIKEKSVQELESMKLNRFVNKIDDIISVVDFYEKYKKLCVYLEQHLNSDYEELKSSQQTNDGLKEILSSIRENGLDLFSMFLFNNFEFLEKLHSEWRKLLPSTDSGCFDADSLLLININVLFKIFKNENENFEKYDKYMSQVKLINRKTKMAGKHIHIFELLMHCSENIGGVTMNIIKAKCREIFN